MLTDKLKDTLVKLAFTYGLDEADMQDAYIRSLNNAGRLDYRVFPKETRKQYQYKTGMESPKIDIQMNKVNGEGLLNHLRSITPSELLQELSGMPAAPTELSLVYKLISVNKISPEMVNLLIFYVLKMNNGKMPTYSYFAKIANEWGRNGLNDLDSAYEYVKGNTKMGSKPDWLKEYRKERVQKDTTNQQKDNERKSKLNLEDVSKRFSSL
jgi:replication initiation and membrane attachment protein